MIQMIKTNLGLIQMVDMFKMMSKMTTILKQNST